MNAVESRAWRLRLPSIPLRSSRLAMNNTIFKERVNETIVETELLLGGSRSLQLRSGQALLPSFHARQGA